MDNELNQPATDYNVFQRIWSSPREVFNYVNDNQYDKYATVLLVLSGIYRTFNTASLKDMGDNYSLHTILSVCIVAGGLFGWITYYIYAALISWTGTWLRAEGDTKSILRVPVLCLIALRCRFVFAYSADINIWKRNV